MAQKFPVIFQCTQKMNPKLLLCSTKPCMICSSLSHPRNTDLLHFPSFSCSLQFFPTRFFDCPETSPVHGCLRASLPPLSLPRNSVYMLCPFSLQEEPGLLRPPVWHIIYLCICLLFHLLPAKCKFYEKKNFVLFIHNYIIRTMPYL